MMTVVLQPEISVDFRIEEVGVVLSQHNVDVFGIHAQSYPVTDPCVVHRLNDDLVLSGQNRNLIVDALEDHTAHDTVDRTGVRFRDLHILRPYDSRDMSTLFIIIHADKFAAAETCLEMSGHHSVEDIALSDKVRDEGVGRLIINILGSSDLLGTALAHDHDLVRHGKCLFLIMGDIYKSDSELVVHVLELDLHLLAHFQIQGAQRLVQEQDLRLIDQGTRDRDPLLLSAGQSLDSAALKSLEIHEFQDPADLAVDHIPGDLFLPQAKGNIIVNIHVRKKGVPLKNSIDRPFVRRQADNRFPVQQDIALRRHIKSRDHPQCCCLSAARRSQKRDKFAAFYFQVKIIYSLKAVVFKDFGDAFQFDNRISVFHLVILLLSIFQVFSNAHTGMAFDQLFSLQCRVLRNHTLLSAPAPSPLYFRTPEGN